MSNRYRIKEVKVPIVDGPTFFYPQIETRKTTLASLLMFWRKPIVIKVWKGFYFDFDKPGISIATYQTPLSCLSVEGAQIIINTHKTQERIAQELFYRNTAMDWNDGEPKQYDGAEWKLMPSGNIVTIHPVE